ncbi:MAG: 3-deoxy-D-manno-octulosonic acid transferase [Deltaproteobacteria bacterium]|nr:3-deoxy-D-manno-octulosonic acid transferase [Deltaproteobacteria bacterium]
MTNILYGAYTLLGSGLLVSCLPPFFIYTRLSGRHGDNLKERLGYLPREIAQDLPGSPRIWLHAVSLGEVKVAAPIIEAFRRIMPACSVIVSTTTKHGRELARNTFGKDVPVVYAPVDFVGSVRKALSRVRPDVLVFLETEIWPAWLSEARQMGIRTALINGRISTRSIGIYLKFRPFFREVLKNIDVFSMILEEDALRIRSIGADTDRVMVNGNAKYDFLATLTKPASKAAMQRTLNLEAFHQVLIAGSTREGEEEMILDAYERILRKFPDTVLVIAPRHIERVPVIGSIIKRLGFGYQLRSDLESVTAKRTEPIVIFNTFGELFNLYSVGTIVFCGASLVPLGGQNPLEPAAWGKVVFYGPSMEDFQDAKALLEEAGAGIEVSSPDMLAEKAIWFLTHPDSLKTYGMRARQAVMRNRDAAEKHAEAVRRLVSL